MSLEDIDMVDGAFEKFWNEEKLKAFDALCEEENLNKEKVKKVVDTYLYDERPPLSDDIANTLNIKPKLLERRKVVPRVLDKDHDICGSILYLSPQNINFIQRTQSLLLQQPISNRKFDLDALFGSRELLFRFFNES
ncbi:Type I restriction and modification enzyme -subunit R C terminal [Wolinella succinogenes]|uniref:type I restriction endonuclease subunit R, EcoR124 family n=1 Tax=Wolinella succinogenes TaxID=844 RepID=UPI000F71F844|nr:hypothetical protein [Wolinella succinogenes]VEG80130.1 Type I restriction and modification enzyme -subunit R C terminal [Wolinella succinogenes]